MLEETSIRGRRARIPWACGHEAEQRTQTFSALRGLILGNAAPSCEEKGRAAPTGSGSPLNLVRFPPLLLAQSLPRKRFLCPALLAGFHVEAVLLDLLDDVFLLHLALEPPQGIFQRLTLLDDDFSHSIFSPPIRFGLVSCGASRQTNCSWLCTSVGTAPIRNYRMYCPLRDFALKGSWHLLINSRHRSQGIFALARRQTQY
jgi:hypothetical protein